MTAHRTTTLGCQVALVGSAALYDAFALQLGMHVDGMFGAIAFMVVLGTYLAQLAVLAIWTALGPGVGWARLLAGVASAYVLNLAPSLGMFLADLRDDWLDWLPFIVSYVPITGLAALLPLWLLRVWRGHRFRSHTLVPKIVAKLPGAESSLATVFEDADGTTPLAGMSARQFGLRDLFVATTVAAVVLGLARLASVGREPAEFWTTTLTACLVVGVSSLLMCVPAVLIAATKSSFGQAVGRAALYGLFVLTTVLATLAVIIFSFSFLMGEAVLLALVFSVSTMAFTVAALRWLGRVGFELRRDGVTA